MPAGTTGAFEGAFYFHCGAYRPAYDCMMRTLGKAFCAVCLQQITAKLQSFQPPVVTGISPAGGSAGGGDAVTVTGTGFTGATGVSLGSVAVPGFAVDSDSQLTATRPGPNASGAVDVTVTTPAGTSAASPASRQVHLRRRRRLTPHASPARLRQEAEFTIIACAIWAFDQVSRSRSQARSFKFLILIANWRDWEKNVQAFMAAEALQDSLCY